MTVAELSRPANSVSPPTSQKAQAVPLLSVKGVTLQYKTPEQLVTATYRVSFDVYAGDRFVLLGPSGCGKSSLLKAVGGFIEPVEGRLEIGGKGIEKPGPDRMMVFQEFDQLLPWKTVRQNIVYPMQVSGRFDKAKIDVQVERLLEATNLTRFADAYPHMLSGGMKQRVAIARAMAMEPAMLLMDEPFAALDALTRRSMQAELLSLWEQTRFTMLFVTHSIAEALIVGTRILLLSPHPGQVRAELDASDVDLASMGSERFTALNDRISKLLFNSAADLQ